MPKKKVFDGTGMTINRLDYSGSTEDPEARLHLCVPLDDQMQMDLNLDGVLKAPEIDLDQGVHLHPGPLDFGDRFKLRIASAPDEDGNQSLVYPERTGVSLVSARAANKKGALNLTLSVLLPLQSWDEFGFLVDYVKRGVEVTIWPGEKQTELGME